MLDDSIYEKLHDAIRKRGEKPASEWFADVQARGVIDEDGRVLIRMPSVPKSSVSITIKDGKSRKPDAKKKG